LISQRIRQPHPISACGHRLIPIDFAGSASDHVAWRWEGAFLQISLIAGAAGERKDNAMKTTMGLEKFEEEILAFEVSDEALEIAAGTSKEKANFTLGACSGLSVCPG
jgi:hypothetical protein